MKHRVRNELCKLASSAYQSRYIVNGTVDQYVLPDEMLDVSCSTIEATLSSPVLAKAFHQDELNELSIALKDFRGLQKHIPFNDANVPNVDLVERNPYWLKVRAIAQKMVEVMRCDIGQWEKQNV